MQQAFELLTLEGDQQGRRVQECAVLGHGLHGLGVLLANQSVQRLIQQRLGGVAEQRTDVGTYLNDVQARFRQGQQHAVGLDGPRKTNGFVGAVGKQLFKIFGFHSNTSWLSSHCSKPLNVERAAITARAAVCVSSGWRAR